MRTLLLLLVSFVIPCRAAMDITRELEAPAHVTPGQPVRVAVTFWTDSWFNPPPEWPEFRVQNGALLNTPLPNQLMTRQKNGISWSGVRLERQVIAWERGTLSLPAVDLTLASSGQAPVTVHLPALEQAIAWPADVHQPDRFLPARNLTLSQSITEYYAGKDKTLRAGDAVERVVTIKGENILPVQIPQILYAIPGDESQQLPPLNTTVKSGRGDIEGVMRQERLRYLPAAEGTLVLPPVKLRWWDTEKQRWQLAELEGKTLKVAAARASGTEAVLRGSTGGKTGQIALLLATLVILGTVSWFFRRQLRRSILWLYHRWHRFWLPVPLPNLAPTRRKK